MHHRVLTRDQAPVPGPGADGSQFFTKGMTLMGMFPVPVAE